MLHIIIIPGVTEKSKSALLRLTPVVHFTTSEADAFSIKVFNKSNEMPIGKNFASKRVLSTSPSTKGGGGAGCRSVVTIVSLLSRCGLLLHTRFATTEHSKKNK